jgi:hypothetical protein
MDSIKKKLFYDSDEDEGPIELSDFELAFQKRKNRKKLDIGMVEVLEWRDVYGETSFNFNDLPPMPLVDITIPSKIISQLKNIRETHHDEFGGYFIFEDNQIISYEGTYGTGGEHDMDIQSDKLLMFHTHPPYKTRLYSPPSELDLGYLLTVCVRNMKSLSHLVFAEEGIYLFYPHPFLLHLTGPIATNFEGNVDFVLKDSVQELRMLLGYSKEGIIYEPKIDLDTFIERINQMGFILKLYPYINANLNIQVTDNLKRYIIEKII